MFLKRLLILAPLALVALLLQSYFWVPSYETQAVGNPARLRTYIEGSIGDAKILNPILNADAASSRITALVFDGLLDLDENLNLRGRLATDWTVTETAYLVARPDRRLADGSPATAARLIEAITDARAAGGLPGLDGTLLSMQPLPAETRTETLSLPAADEPGGVMDVDVALRVPPRVVFTLARVDQDFFDRLEPVLGEDYFDDFPYAAHVSPAESASEAQRTQVAARATEMLPLAEHNPVIRFRLRTGVRFHDGHPFDAGDVKFTYDALMNPRNLSPRTSDYEPIKRVDVLDAHTVVVTYKRLYSPAINAWMMGILPEHLLNAAALAREMQAQSVSDAARAGFGMRDSAFNRAPVGTGPFRFVEWRSDEFIKLARNDDYWERPPEYAHYYFRVIPDLLTQEVEFKSGAIDAYGVQPHQVARYKQDDTYQSFSSLGFGYTYIGYNNRKPLFADPRVRRALGMAINTDDIITYVLYGEGERTTGPYPRQTEWYDHGIQPLPYDPAAAQRLLAEAGWRPNADGWLEKDGTVFEFTLITNNGNPLRANVLAIAQDAWKKIGVRCRTQVFEWAVFLQDFVNTGSFDAVVLGWSMGIDPDLYQIFHSSQAGPQQLNFVGYASPEADALIVCLRREYDRAAQRALAHRLHRTIAEDQPYTFLYVGLATRVLDRKIVLVEREPGGGERFAKIYPTRSGSIAFYFNKWRKLEFTPDF